MIGEPRTIGRIIELFHIPIQHTPETLREVYQEISGSCGYDNFIRIAGGARMETAASEGVDGVSRVSFLKDRISFHEEHTSIGPEGLQRRLEAVIGCATEKLSIPIFIIRNITLRAIAAAPRGQNSSQFIAENLFRIQGSELAPFGRPGSLIGFRMHFPTTDPKIGAHQVRIESYLRDPRMLFLEDAAAFKIPLQSRDTRKLAGELREAEEFLHERMTSFLNQFPR